jgi:hypothetical protein
MRYLQRMSNFCVWSVGRRAGPLFDCVHFIIAKLNKKGTGTGIFNKDLDLDPDGQK